MFPLPLLCSTIIIIGIMIIIIEYSSFNPIPHFYYSFCHLLSYSDIFFLSSLLLHLLPSLLLSFPTSPESWDAVHVISLVEEKGTRSQQRLMNSLDSHHVKPLQLPFTKPLSHRMKILNRSLIFRSSLEFICLELLLFFYSVFVFVN